MADFEEVQTDAAPADDIRALLNSAVEEHEAPEAETPKAAEAPADASEKPAGERARGPDGKFIRTEAERADDEAKAAVKPEPEKAAATEKPAEAPASKDAPAHWPEADKAKFKALPADAQEFLLRRHNEMTADYTRKTQEAAQERQQIQAFRQEFEPIAQLMAPYRPLMEQRGVTIAKLFESWYSVEKRLMDGDGVNVVKGLVDNYRIPRERIAAALGLQPALPQLGPDGQPLPVVQDPTPRAELPPEITQKLTQVEQWMLQQQRQQEMIAAQQHQENGRRVMSEIEQFASATDNAGAPLHPYFKEVEAAMADEVSLRRLRGEVVPPLSELYEKAVWANTSTRAQLLAADKAAQEAQQKAAADQRKEEARAKAEQSRRAGASVSGAPGGGPQAAGRARSTGSVREDLAAAMEELDA